MAELIRFRISDFNGVPLPGESIEMARSGETAQECVRRLKDEFGERLLSADVEIIGRKSD